MPMKWMMDMLLCTGRPARAAAVKPYPAGTFHIGLRKFVRCRSEAQNLCTSLNGRCPSGVRLWPTLSGCLYLVGVNVAIYNTGDGKGTENKTRLWLERVIFRASFLFVATLTLTRLGIYAPRPHRSPCPARSR